MSLSFSNKRTYPRSSLLYLSDIHSHLHPNKQSYISLLRDFSSKVDPASSLIIIGGDLVGSHDQLKPALNLIFNNIGDVPAVFTHGNHDCYFPGSINPYRNRDFQDFAFENLCGLKLYTENAPVFDRHYDCCSLSLENGGGTILVVVVPGWHSIPSPGKREIYDKYIADSTYLQFDPNSKHKFDLNYLKSIDVSIDTYQPTHVIIASHYPLFAQKSQFSRPITKVLDPKSAARSSTFDSHREDLDDFFYSPLLGKVVIDMAKKYRNINFICLAGHIHNYSCIDPLPNLVSVTNHAELNFISKIVLSLE